MVPKWGDGCAISLIVVISSQRIRVSNHHIVHLKYLQFLFVNYTPVKMRKTPDLIVRLFCVYVPPPTPPDADTFPGQAGHRACPRDRGPFRGLLLAPEPPCVPELPLCSGPAVSPRKSRRDAPSLSGPRVARGHLRSLTRAPCRSGSLGPRRSDSGRPWRLRG